MSVNRGTDLAQALAKTLAQVNAQIAEITDEATLAKVSPHKMRDANGGYILTPLLAAKAQCLHALVLVNQRRS